VTREAAWSPSNGCYVAPTPARYLTARQLPVAPLPFPGAFFTQVEGDEIRSEEIYFDRQNLFEQLGPNSRPIVASWELQTKTLKSLYGFPHFVGRPT